MESAQNSFTQNLIHKLPIKLLNTQQNNLVLIAGAAGFVGSFLAEALCDLGVRVIGVDIFSTGKDKNLSKLKDKENFELVETDIIKNLPASLRKEKFTHIVDVIDTFPHIGSKDLTLSELLANSYGLKNLLDLANRNQSQVIFTSSVYVYRGLASHESLHNYFDGPELSTFYTFLEGKRYGEALCHEYVDRYGIDVRIARFPEIYGPRMDLNSSSLMSRLIRLALESKDFIIDEEGSREHQLVYVDDAIYGLLKLMFNEDKRSRASIFYFTNPERVSTLSIAYSLRAMVGKDLKVDFIPHHRKVELPSISNIDISRTEKVLKWDPKIDLTNGVERTLSWFVEAAKNPSAEPLPDQFWHKDLSGQAENDDGSDSDETSEDRMAEDLSDSYLPSVKKLAEQGEAKPESKTFAEKTKDRLGWLSLKRWGHAKNQPLDTLEEKETSMTGLSQDTLAREPFRIGRFRVSEIAIGVGVILLFLLLPLMISAGFGFRSYQGFKSLNFGLAESSARQSVSFFEMYRAPAVLIGLKDYYQNVEEGMRTSIYAARTADSAQRVLEPMLPHLDRLGYFLGGKNQDGTPENIFQTKAELTEDLQKANLPLSGLEADYALMKEHLDMINERYLPGFLQSRVREFRDFVWLYSEAASSLDGIISKLPVIFGYEGPQRYVLLFQNNNEMRATGGFIGSYAVIEVENGTIRNFKVDDIYNPDGLLSEHNEPGVPEEMQRYLGVKFMSLRDSNWWPEFSTDARIFADLYGTATQEAVHGVISLNLSLVEELLRITGPIRMEGYDEEVTAENLSERAQFYSEVGFEPGSTQKKDFLGELANALISEVLDNKRSLSRDFGVLLAKGLASREILLSSTHNDIQSVWDEMWLSGNLIVSDNDYLKVVDSNVGGNKSNLWVERISKYSVNVDRNGNLSADLSITWDHTGTSGTWPNGDYKNYVRIYIPQETFNIKVDPEMADQKIYREFGKTVIAGLVEVPIDTSKNIRVRYSLPTEISLKNTDDYQLVWENQPGMREQGEFKLNLPEFLTSEFLVKRELELDYPIHLVLPIQGQGEVF